MEKSKEDPRIIDCDSDSDEFSDAIDTHAEVKGDDDFFDVPEWREEKAKNEGIYATGGPRITRSRTTRFRITRF